MSDETLLEQARKGSEESFATLYRRHQGRVYRYALRMTGSAGLAEEVTQEVFLAVIRDMDRYDAGRGSFLPYLLGAARNVTHRMLRKEPPFVPLEGPEEGPAEPASGTEPVVQSLTRQEDLAALDRAIDSLPPAYREVLVLCELEELDYAQAAQAMQCAIGTVRSRLHRARALLGEKWKAQQKMQAMRCPG